MRRILLILFLSVTFLSNAQVQSITGKVVSATEPNGMIGVNVFIKGTTQGTITDIEGNFTLSGQQGSILVASFLGFKTQEVPFIGQTNIIITLEEDAKQLAEIVVTGYSSVSKRDLTGAVSTVKGDRVKDMSVTGLDQALQGQAPGVQVVQSSGTPGGGISVRIRGSTSINASNRPLFIVDGVPISTGGLSQREFGGQNDNALALINPNDIEDMQILQDAAAKAMYGSRGSNGVVLITTKHGKNGVPKITFDAQRGIIDPVHTLDLLNSKQLLELQRESVTNAGQNPDAFGLIPGVTDAVNTNWQKEVLRRAVLQQYQLTASGGDDLTTFYMSGSYRDEQGIQLNNRFRRLTGVMNMSRKFSSKLTVGTDINLSYSINNRVKGDNFLDGVYSGAIKSLPFDAPYDETGHLIGPGSPSYPGFPNFNPVAQALLPRFITTSVKILSNLNIGYKITDNLIYKSVIGIDYNDAKEDQFESSQTAIGGYLSTVGGQGYGIYSTNTTSNFIANSVLSYNKDYGKNKLSALLGTELLNRPSTSSSVSGRLFPSDDFTYITSAGIVDNGSSYKVRSSLLSFFGEAKYNVNDKYLFSLGMRADGSSRFGPGNRFGYFPAVSGAWRISEEKFFKSQIISDLKLRGSLGYTGNERIGDFQFLGSWGTGTYNGSTGVVPSQLGNPKLKWETTREINIGLNLALLNGRIQTTIDVYNNKTFGLLYNRTLAETTGFPSVLDNISILQNKGFTLGINTINTDGIIKWSTDINLSKNINKILYLADSIPVNTGYQGEGGVYTNVIKQGLPLGTFMGLKYLGVDPATGDALYEDHNHDGKISNEDAVVIGNAQPKLIGGITNKVSYKNFDLSVFFQFSYGNSILNLTKATLLNPVQDLTSNQTTEALRRWKKPGDITDVPRYQYTTQSDQTLNNQQSSRLIEDGSYLRLKNLALGYSVPASILNKLRLSNARVYCSATNLWTFTKYKGSDPEVSTLDGSTTAQGIDFFTLPQVRTIAIGLNLTLK